MYVQFEYTTKLRESVRGGEMSVKTIIFNLKITVKSIDLVLRDPQSVGKRSHNLMDTVKRE
jgi:hypothetical protein